MVASLSCKPLYIYIYIYIYNLFKFTAILRWAHTFGYISKTFTVQLPKKNNNNNNTQKNGLFNNKFLFIVYI